MSVKMQLRYIFYTQYVVYSNKNRDIMEQWKIRK